MIYFNTIKRAEIIKEKDLVHIVKSFGRHSNISLIFIIFRDNPLLSWNLLLF